MFDDVLFYKVTLNFTRRCGQGGQEATYVRKMAVKKSGSTLFALLRLFNHNKCSSSLAEYSVYLNLARCVVLMYVNFFVIFVWSCVSLPSASNYSTTLVSTRWYPQRRHWPNSIPNGWSTLWCHWRRRIPSCVCGVFAWVRGDIHVQRSMSNSQSRFNAGARNQARSEFL